MIICYITHRKLIHRPSWFNGYLENHSSTIAEYTLRFTKNVHKIYHILGHKTKHEKMSINVERLKSWKYIIWLQGNWTRICERILSGGKKSPHIWKLKKTLINNVWVKQEKKLDNILNWMKWNPVYQDLL